MYTLALMGKFLLILKKNGVKILILPNLIILFNIFMLYFKMQLKAQRNIYVTYLK